MSISSEIVRIEVHVPELGCPGIYILRMKVDKSIDELDAEFISEISPEKKSINPYFLLIEWLEKKGYAEVVELDNYKVGMATD